MNKIFKVLISKISIIQDYIDKLNRKAVRHGLPLINFIIGKVITECLDHDGIKAVRIFNEISVDIPELKISNFNFIAKINHIETGNLVKKSPLFNDFITPKDWYDVEPHCQHCNIKRYRTDTFILQNIDSGEIKQIGRNCLKDFIGHDVENFIAMVEMTQDLINIINDCKSGEDSFSFGSNNYGYSLEIFLNYVAMVNRFNGFISSKYNNSTRDQVYEILNPINRNMLDHKYDIQPNDEDLKNAKLALDWINSLENSDNDYLINLKNAVKIGYVNYKNDGLISSLIFAYKKSISKKISEKGEVNKISNYFGKINEKIQRELTYIMSFSFDSDFGICFIHKFEDIEGNIFIWKTNNNINMDERRALKVKGTIKEHKEYKGIKQTILTRCKVQEI